MNQDFRISQLEQQLGAERRASSGTLFSVKESQEAPLMFAGTSAPGCIFDGKVWGPTKIHSTIANSDPTKRYVKVKVSTDPFTITELAVLPDVWGTDEMIYDKHTHNTIVITRFG
jgi:hypothetical protein